MVVRQTIRGLLGILAIGCVMTGCAQSGGRPFGQAGLFGQRARKNDEVPPAPAPPPLVAAPSIGSPSAPAANPASAPGIALASAQEGPPLQPPTLGDPKGSPSPPLIPPSTAPPASSAPADPMAPLRDLYHKAALKHASMDSYTVRLRRREVVGTQPRPEEILLFKWRKEPWSVYFKWLGPEGKGREVVYVKGRYDNALHTLTAAGDVPFLPAGRRFKVAPDSIMVKAKSRYPITEAGLGGLVERFGRLVDAQQRGDTSSGTLKYLGQVKRPEFDNKMEGVLQTIPPKGDPHLARGGQRQWYFDPVLQLPMLLITFDDTGREVEYYCHDRFLYPVNLTDDDFNPDVLWKSSAAR